MSSLSNRNTNNTKSVILVSSFLASSLKIYFILKSLIRGVLLPDLIWWPISLIPPIRSSMSECWALFTTSISFNGEIISPCSYYAKKGLVCIIIIFSTSRQPSFYFKCIKADTRSLYNMRAVPLNKYIFLGRTRLYTY